MTDVGTVVCAHTNDKTIKFLATMTNLDPKVNNKKLRGLSAFSKYCTVCRILRELC